MKTFTVTYSVEQWYGKEVQTITTDAHSRADLEAAFDQYTDVQIVEQAWYAAYQGK